MQPKDRCLEAAGDYLSKEGKRYAQQLVADGRSIEGFLTGDGQTVVLIADNLASAGRALEVVLHEIVGHYGLDALERAAPEIRKIARQLYGHAALLDPGALLRAAHGVLDGVVAGKINPAKWWEVFHEYVAQKAERPQSVWRRFVAAVRLILQKYLGLRWSLRIKMVEDLLDAQREFLRRPAATAAAVVAAPVGAKGMAPAAAEKYSQPDRLKGRADETEPHPAPHQLPTGSSAGRRADVLTPDARRQQERVGQYLQWIRGHADGSSKGLARLLAPEAELDTVRAATSAGRRVREVAARLGWSLAWVKGLKGSFAELNNRVIMVDAEHPEQAWHELVHARKLPQLDQAISLINTSSPAFREIRKATLAYGDNLTHWRHIALRDLERRGIKLNPLTLEAAIDRVLAENLISDVIGGQNRVGLPPEQYVRDMAEVRRLAAELRGPDELSFEASAPPDVPTVGSAGERDFQGLEKTDVRRSDQRLRGPEAAGGFIGKTLAAVRDDLPALPLEPDQRLDIQQNNLRILQAAKTVFEKLYGRVLPAADGAQVRIQNPRYPTSIKMLQHLIFNNTTKSLDIVKSAWLPMIERTLQNAAVRIRDSATGEQGYVARYSDDTYHVVFVHPDGDVARAEVWKGGAISTQFPLGRTARQWNYQIVWERKARGQLQGDPAATPPTSTIPGSRPEAFRDESSAGADNVKYSDNERLRGPEAEGEGASGENPYLRQIDALNAAR